MKDTFFIIIFGMLVYLGFATVLGDTALMGSYGAKFAEFNHEFFGYISYVYIFLALIPLYIFYKNTTLNIRKFELVITSFLVLFSSLLAQAILVKDELRGLIGGDFVNFLAPYIGVFGLWIFWIIITLVSVVIIVDKSAHEIVDALLGLVKSKFDIAKNNRETKQALHVEHVKEKEPPLHVEDSVSEVEENFAQDITEDVIVEEMQHIAEIDKPSYLRKEEDTKEKSTNILDLVHDIKEKNGAIVVEELEENAKLLATIEKGKVEKPKNFKLPSVDFLQKAPKTAKNIDESELDEKIHYLIEKLAHFKIDGDVVRTYAGPVVSTFEFKPAANVKVSKILNLQDDLAMALSAETIRIQAPIPGKDVVGIEIPNETVDTIYLREILDDKLFKDSSSPLTIVLGKDIVGKPFVTDLKKLPHLLIAGTTGSGKSVGINAMILSLLY
ncbi:MAG: DNA translocase FtsK 4TM domain-containing protein, partial [Campylobacterales bacterium]